MSLFALSYLTCPKNRIIYNPLYRVGLLGARAVEGQFDNVGYKLIPIEGQEKRKRKPISGIAEIAAYAAFVVQRKKVV